MMLPGSCWRVDDEEHYLVQSYTYGCRQVVTGSLEFTWISSFS